jgi:hypothetical protein
MLSVIKGKRKPEDAKQDVITLKKEYSKVKFGFQSVQDAIDHINKS